jgi:hypothetical protein
LFTTSLSPGGTEIVFAPPEPEIVLMPHPELCALGRARNRAGGLHLAACARLKLTAL